MPRPNARARESGHETKEGVRTYGGSYSSVTSSGNIRNEIRVMRFPCNEKAMSDGFEKRIIWHRLLQKL